MNIDSASTFLVGSVLLTISLVILTLGAVTINNLLHKYWKPVTLFSADSWTLFGNTSTDDYVRNHPEYKAAEAEPTFDVKDKKK